MMNSYVAALQIDFSSLLDWKLNRSVINVVNIDVDNISHSVVVNNLDKTAVNETEAEAEDEAKSMGNIATTDPRVILDSSSEGESKVIEESTSVESKVIEESTEVSSQL
jgi:hypothetical protein